MEKNKKTNLRQKLEKLEEFIDSKKQFSENELLEWISDCVSIFTEIGVHSNILDGFLKTFQSSLKDLDPNFRSPYFIVGKTKDKYLGPFIFIEYPKPSYYKICDDWSLVINKPSKDIYYVHIAFVSAYSVLRRDDELELLSPAYLINILSYKKEYVNIVSSLEQLNVGYKDVNPDSIIKNSITLLDSVLDLCSELSNVGHISKKLKKLKGDKDILEKFGVSKEYICALDNSRLIRNINTHKSKLINYNVPFVSAVAIAHLVVIFLEITLSTGVLIEE